MKAKIFSSLGFVVLFLLVLTGFTSATISFSEIPTLNQTGNSFTINVTTNETESINFSLSTIEDYDNRAITFSIPSNNINFNGDSAIITVNYNIESEFNFFGKEYSTTLIANGSNSGVYSQKLSFETINFCSYENDFDNFGNRIKIEIKDINVIRGFGEDTNWYLFDEIEVEVRVSATNSKVDISDISLEWGLFDTKSGEWAIEIQEEDEFSLEGGEKETFLIKFKLDNSLDIKLDDLSGSNLVFYVRATGILESDTSSEDGTASCHSQFTTDNYKSEINLKSESKFVILDKIDFIGPFSCEKDIQISANVWNIGSKNQEGVYIIIYNQELGLNHKVEIGNIDSFEYEKLNTIFKLPSTAEEKTYNFLIYIYDKKGNLYETKSDDSSVFYYPIKVEKACSKIPTASVSASLQSEAKAGKDFVVKTTIVNTGSETKTFTVSASNYADWASATLDKTSVTLSAGQSTDVLITFNVNKGVSGEQGFDIEVLDGKMNYLSQPVSVDVKSGFSLPSLTGLVSGFQDNFYFYGIIALNVILVLVIVVVAVRIAKKKKQRV